MDNNMNDDSFLTEQIITYIGNKRSLLKHIHSELVSIKEELNKEKLVSLDLFSGSGVVSRLFKQHSSKVIANDLEGYSKIINECYLTNKTEFDDVKYLNYLDKLNEELKQDIVLKPLISKYYAPCDDKDIKAGERVFYTTQNSRRIDIIREFINSVEEDYQKFFLGQLLYEASVHTNTGGIFKGFYKDSATGIGKYGGNGENALARIKSEIKITTPVLSEFESDYIVYQKDANELVKSLKHETIDVAYLDPPYNQHPYGSNYFMLNVILNQKVDPEKISKVSGIPNDWNRSRYNKKKEALIAFDELISNTMAQYILISYNSDGFISQEEMYNILSKYGEVEVREIKYNTYRASRNLRSRELHVNEYLYKLKKWGD